MVLLGVAESLGLCLLGHDLLLVRFFFYGRCLWLLLVSFLLLILLLLLLMHLLVVLMIEIVLCFGLLSK